MTHSAFYSVWTNNLYRVTSDISLSFYGSTIIFCYFTLGRLRILQSSMLSWDCTKIQNTYSTAFFTDVLVQWTAIKQTYENREIALRLRTHYSTAFLLMFCTMSRSKNTLRTVIMHGNSIQLYLLWLSSYLRFNYYTEW